jgi:hypothetical protein
MSSITVVDNGYVTLHYYPEHKIVHHIIQQPISGQPFRDALMCGTDLLRKYGADKWLSDDRKNAQLSAEDNEWGRKVWFAETQAAGWKYWALVVPADMQAQMSLVEVVQNFTQLGVNTRVFTETDKALAWLESV